MYRLLLGQTVGNRYEVLSLLGRGGMGAVYLAMDTTLERHIALKAVTLDERVQGTGSVRARFRREARLAASIRHPNVVTVHDFFSDERLDLEFLVMEHLDGEDLGQRVQRAGPLAPGDALDLLTQAWQPGIERVSFIVTSNLATCFYPAAAMAGFMSMCSISALRRRSRAQRRQPTSRCSGTSPSHQVTHPQSNGAGFRTSPRHRTCSASG